MMDWEPIMTDPVDSNPAAAPEERTPPDESWLKVGTIAALSALAGGLAAAWYYRKTLTRLKEAEDAPVKEQNRSDDEA
jgi:hypothetical protein